MNSTVSHLLGLNIKPLNSRDFLPLSEAEVAAIEVMIGVPLPASYKQYLLILGGCIFPANVVFRSAEPPLYPGCLYGFAELTGAIGFLNETLPEAIIPIGDDGGDVVLCLGVKNDVVGRVFIHNTHIGWNDEATKYLQCGEPIPSDLRYQTVEPVSLSFEQFVESLSLCNE